MQVIRQSLTIAFQRPVILGRSSSIIQQIRFDGSDPRSSTSPDKHKAGKQSDPSKGTDLKKSKGGDKKGKSSTTNDAKQPGTTRQDWSKPNQVVGNDPTYGKAGGSSQSNQ